MFYYSGYEFDPLGCHRGSFDAECLGNQLVIYGDPLDFEMECQEAVKVGYDSAHLLFLRHDPFSTIGLGLPLL